MDPNISLNIDAYSLQDIANLFKLNSLSGIQQDDMKSARKMVMMTHPDKSGLSKEYFQFFAKAYERLNDVVDFMNRTSQTSSGYMEKHRKIDVAIDSKDGSLGTALKKARIITDTYTVGKGWNTWKKEFDKWFEQNGELSGRTADNGYDEFMKSTEGLLPEGATKEQAVEFMNSRKAALGALVLKENITGVETGSLFGSSSGSGFGEDLRKAYTETVVPVTEDDFNSVPQFSSLDEFRRHRHSVENVSDNDYEIGKITYRKEMASMEERELTEYYEHLRQFEKNKSRVDEFQRKILRLTQ